MSSILKTASLIICFVAGKSGGHLIPCLTDAQQKHTTDTTILFTGGRSLEHTITTAQNHTQTIIPATLPEKTSFSFPYSIPLGYALIRYFFNSFFTIKYLAPHKVVSYGGLNSIPVCIAAWLNNITIELHELNVVPGKAITFLSYFTNKIYMCFEKTKSYFPRHRCFLEAYPVRTYQQPPIHTLYKKYALNPDKQTLLILGGSQGAERINQALYDICIQQPHLLQQYNIIHITGHKCPIDFYTLYNKHNITAFVTPFSHELYELLHITNKAISRAGAGAIFELKAYNVTTLLIPLMTPNNSHQKENAVEVSSQFPQQFLYTLDNNPQSTIISFIYNHYLMDH